MKINRKMIPFAAVRVAQIAEELVFPRRCPVCDRPVRPFGALICPDCEPMLHRVKEPVCHRCGKPLRSKADQFCADCLRNPHIFDRGCAVFTYHSAAGGIFRFKYGGRREYSAYYGRCMAQRLRELCAELSAADRQDGKRYPAGAALADRTPPRMVFDMLVPVPVSSRRYRKRGYNQAALLAGEISRDTGIPVREDLLQRTADTLPMKNMGFADRQNNLKKAFHCSGNDVKLSSIMLIDDIYTTGATVDACAQALYRRGAARVCFLTLAIGEDGYSAQGEEYNAE